MRILVTGSHGQLGRELLQQDGTDDRSFTGIDIDTCDITNPTAVSATLDQDHFDAVINCAAYTRVDAAEQNPDAAFAVNVEGPKVLAEACASRDILLCQISTDFVFDGSSRGPIDESAATNPLSVYGRTKLLGEEAVRTLAPRHQIVRTAWLYGQDGPNFVLTMLRLARERGELRVVNDQHGSPTWTGDLAPAVLRLVSRGACGTFHLTNSGSTTWYGFAQEIVDAAGLAVLVHAVATDDYPTPAARPPYSVLDNRAWRTLGEPPLEDWRLAIRHYLATRSPG